MVSCWNLHLIKDIVHQDVLLDGDCVGSMLGVVMGEIINNSVNKHDDDKVGC